MKNAKSNKSEDTRKFYNDLVEGKVSRSIWGKDKRFSPDIVAGKQSVEKYFTSVVKRYISNTDTVLDLGCGPGSFLSLVAGISRTIVGADITPKFIDECDALIAKQKLANATAVLIKPGALPFPDQHFDRIIMIDTIHHLEDAADTMNKVYRILKTSGLLLVFEPNKYNPLLYLMCCLDKNERGLLRLGTINKYRDLIGSRYEVIAEEYNGLLIGPEGRLSLYLADMCSSPSFSRILGWLNPKVFLAARKR